MKLILGLGNLGEKYTNNRHNVGFMVVDALASEVVGGKWVVDRNNYCTLYTNHKSLILAKPVTMMNSSGIAVSKIARQYKIKMPDIWVIHDDLDLRLGEYKIQFGIGPKLHYGISSIEEKLQSKDFWRVRVGVDNREKDLRIPGEKYVLQNFKDSELVIINRVINDVITELRRRVEI